jgi:hypothetical protein
MNRTGKVVLLSVAGVVIATGAVWADHLGLYSDTQGGSCWVQLTAPFATTSVYVIHKFTAGTTGSRFRVKDASTLYQAGSWTPYAALGNPYSGVSIAYGGCLAGQVNAMTLSYIWFNQPVACGKLEIVRDPMASDILSADCSFAEKVASGGGLYFNPNGNCEVCPGENVGELTWGKVKALYR